MSEILKHGAGPSALVAAVRWHGLTDLVDCGFPFPAPWDTELVFSHVQTREEMLKLLVSKYTPIETRIVPLWVRVGRSWTHYRDQFYSTIEQVLARNKIAVGACERIVFVERYAPTPEDTWMMPHESEPILPTYNLYVYTRPNGLL